MKHKRIIALMLTTLLFFTNIGSVPAFAIENAISIDNAGSFGWTETLTVTVTVSDELQRANPNALAIGLTPIGSFSMGNLILTAVNGISPTQSSDESWPLYERVRDSIQYLDDDGDEIYYSYSLPYKGEKELVLTLNADDHVSEYVEYAVSVGLYTVEEVTVDEYNQGKRQPNEQCYSSDIYFRIIEHDVLGTSVQVAPVEITYQKPVGYENMEIRVYNDENPYRDQFDLSMRTDGDHYLNPLEAHINQQITYIEYEFEHRINTSYSLEKESEKEDYLKNLATMGFTRNSMEDYQTDYLIPLEENLLDKFNAVEGYRTIGKVTDFEDRKDHYTDESGQYHGQVNHRVDMMVYEESLIFIMPNDVLHIFTYSKFERFPDAYFNFADEFKNAAFDFEHFMNVFSFVPKNNGMTPEEYGEFMKGPDTLSIRLISDRLTVLNTGIYNTATKSDSDFSPGIRINKPNDYTETLFLRGDIISDDQNPPIAFVEAKEALLRTKIVDSDSMGFHMVTKGIKGGEKNGTVYNPIQKVRFSLRNANDDLMAPPVTLTVTLADASPKIKILKGPKTAAQSGGERSFEIEVTDPDNEEVSIRVTSVFGKVRPLNGTFAKQFEATVNTDEAITIGFQAPEIGNFNLNKEMENLSMVALQEGTFNTLMADLEGMYLGKFTDKLKDKYSFNNKLYRGVRNWDDYSDKMDAINNIKSAKDAYEKWKKAKDAYGHFSNTMNVVNAGLGGEQLGKDLYEATNIENKGVFEATTDAGIAGISVLQSGVGLFSSAVSYVPGGRVIGSKATLWFNLATNVWKGNLQYLSKMEKINRADEVIEMIPVVVVATDASGFSTRFVILVPVVGMEV